MPLGTVSADSRPGPGRDRNDDRWAAAVGNGTLLLAVADGMGATAGGGTAATIALHAVLDVLTAVPLARDATGGRRPAAMPAAPGPDPAGPGAALHPAAPTDETTALAAALAAAVACGQRRVRAAVPAGFPEAVRPGTTLTAALVCADRVHLAHVGDSSCWLYRGGLLRRLTDVHTSAAVLVAAGAVDRDSTAARRLDNLLTRYLGMPGRLEPQLCTFGLRGGDRLLLASDGLTRVVPPGSLARLVARRHATAAELVDAAVGGAGSDDVTAVLLTVAAGYAGAAEAAAFADGTKVTPPSATRGLPAASSSDGWVVASGWDMASGR